MNRIDNVICCPECGYQYLPSEIFFPDVVFGRPEFIRRNIKGEIEAVSGSNPELLETYCCDNCGTTFKVSIDMKFKSIVDVVSDFSKDYSISIKSGMLLKED